MKRIQPRVDDLAAAAWAALADVHDPEIPVLSIVDLGLVEDIHVGQDGVAIDLLPTFTGCPALDVIADEATRAVQAATGLPKVQVRWLLSPAWSTDRMTAHGRERLKQFGIAPAAVSAPPQPQAAVGVACPYCGATETVMESAFGPTRCRTIYYCRACRNPFEKLKEI